LGGPALDNAAIAALADRVGPLLPLDGDLTPVPVLAEVPVPASRVLVPASLAPLCTVDVAARAAHTYGKAFRDVVRALRGTCRTAPDVVAHPATEADVAAVLDWAATAGAAVVPYGGGTSVVGGVECRDRTRPVVSLDLRGLSGVVEIDPVSLTACVRGGTLGPSIEEGLKPHGLTLRHFPQSFEFSTLGGWIAHPGRWPLRHRLHPHRRPGAVGPDGDPGRGRRVGPVPGSGAGPAPDRLWLGSEGILGVVTEAWVRVQRRPTGSPRPRSGSPTTTPPCGRAADRAVGAAAGQLRLLDALEAMLGAGVTDGSAGCSCRSKVPAMTPARPSGGAGHRDRGRWTAGRGDLDAAISNAATRRGREWRGSFLRAPYLRDAWSGWAPRGDVRDRLHLVFLRRPARGRHRRVAAAGGVRPAASPTSTRTARAVLHRLRPRSSRRRGRAVGPAQGRVSEAIAATAAPSPTTTRSVATTALVRPERPEPFADRAAGGQGALDPNGILNPGVLI
jgi:alkyldihydroxyacetonephosphate synthase